MEKEPILGSKRTIFIYSSGHLAGSNKVKFFYALKGREKNPGLVDNKTIFQPSKKILIADSSKKEYVQSFLDFWKCTYEIVPEKQTKDKDPRLVFYKPFEGMKKEVDQMEDELTKLNTTSQGQRKILKMIEDFRTNIRLLDLEV